MNEYWFGFFLCCWIWFMMGWMWMFIFFKFKRCKRRCLVVMVSKLKILYYVFGLLLVFIFVVCLLRYFDLILIKFVRIMRWFLIGSWFLYMVSKILSVLIWESIWLVGMVWCMWLYLLVEVCIKRLLMRFWWVLYCWLWIRFFLWLESICCC